MQLPHAAKNISACCCHCPIISALSKLQCAWRIPFSSTSRWTWHRRQVEESISSAYVLAKLVLILIFVSFDSLQRFPQESWSSPLSARVIFLSCQPLAKDRSRNRHQSSSLPDFKLSPQRGVTAACILYKIIRPSSYQKKVYMVVGSRPQNISSLDGTNVGPLAWGYSGVMYGPTIGSVIWMPSKLSKLPCSYRHRIPSSRQVNLVCFLRRFSRVYAADRFSLGCSL